MGASLGAVEIALALHSVFQSPDDTLLWDTGHQAYAHKLLTGRWEAFSSLRRKDGIAGFLSREESPHDAFGAGHAGTILSAAAGISWARQATSPQAWTVAVVGDGSLTTGLSFEALNHLQALKTGPLFLVINDNRYSIGQNIGAIPAILASPVRAKEYFAAFGFEWVDPVDGHDLKALTQAFKSVRGGKIGQRVVMVARTEKGRGYAPALEDPVKFHGISAALAASKIVEAPTNKIGSFSESLGATLIERALSDPKLVVITAAMAEGTGLQAFARRFPQRFFDVGISEQHAVTFAAGLATQGLRPVVAIYSTFAQRALDQVIHDVCLQKLPVTFALDRAGLVGQDGATHHGAFDLAYLGMIPNIRVVAPSSYQELRGSLLNPSDTPLAVRYPRGAGATERPESQTLLNAGWASLRPASSEKKVIVALGTAIEEVWKSAQTVDPDGDFLSVELLIQAKPLPTDWLEHRARRKTPILFVEHGAARGGVGEHLAALLSGRVEVDVAGIPDRFVAHALPAEQLQDAGLDARHLTRRLQK